MDKLYDDSFEKSYGAERTRSSFLAATEQSSGLLRTRSSRAEVKVARGARGRACCGYMRGSVLARRTPACPAGEIWLLPAPSVALLSHYPLITNTVVIAQTNISLKLNNFFC